MRLVRCLFRKVVRGGLFLLLVAPLFADEPAEKSEAPKEGEAAVSFVRDVAPIFAKHCLACHDNSQAKGGLNLTTFEGLMKGGEQGDTVVPEDADLSNLTILLEGGQMPKDGDPLPKEQIALVKNWIKQGAKFDGPSPTAAIATLIPKEPHPQPPDSYRVPVPINALALSPDGSVLAASGYHEITLWNPADGKLLRRITNVAQRTYGLTFSPDGKLLAVACGTPGEQGEVKIFNAADGTLAKDLLTTSDAVFAVAFSPDGKRLAAGGADRSIRIWIVETGEQKVLIEDHADWVFGVAWSPDGSRLVSASRDKTAKVFNTENGESLVTFPGHGEPVYAAAFSQDGKLVATCGRDKQIRLWNPEDGKEAKALGGHSADVDALVFTPDGTAIYTGSADKTVRQFDPAVGKEARVFTGHTEWVYSIAYCAATKRLASGSWDGQIRLWDAQEGKQLLEFVAAPGYTPPAAAPAAAAAGGN